MPIVRPTTETEPRCHGAHMILACVALVVLPGAVAAQSLRGSAASLDRQTTQAARHDFTYLRGTARLRRFVESGLLVSVAGNRNYTLDGEVSFPVARPEARLFIERLAGQYRRACGERLVVTSLTRPKSHQPGKRLDPVGAPNGDGARPASSTGDLPGSGSKTRCSTSRGRGCWRQPRERRPPHYHVAGVSTPVRGLRRCVDGPGR